MRFQSLAQFKRPAAIEKTLRELPTDVYTTDFALEKGFRINEVVRKIHGRSYEWYGFTIAHRSKPEVIMDIGIPNNNQNMFQYTSISPANIVTYQESLNKEKFINGWVHSHGDIDCHQFSDTDEENSITVLDYVVALQRIAVKKKQVPVDDLNMLVKGQHCDNWRQGSVTIITDNPVGEINILETIYGGFCYAIVVGDGGWHRQQVYHKRRGILTGETVIEKIEADMISVPTGRFFTDLQLSALAIEVKNKIRPAENSVLNR
jgi:hypothetical protein